MTLTRESVGYRRLYLLWQISARSFPQYHHSLLSLLRRPGQQVPLTTPRRARGCNPWRRRRSFTLYLGARGSLQFVATGPSKKCPPNACSKCPAYVYYCPVIATRPITRWIRRRAGDRSTASAASSLGEWPAWRQNSPPLDSLIDPLAADRLRVAATTGPFSPGYRSLGEAPCVSARSPFTPITKRPCATGMYWQEKPP